MTSSPFERRALVRFGHFTGRSGASGDRKSTGLNSSHTVISYAVFCLKKKKLTADLRQDRLQQQQLVPAWRELGGANAVGRVAAAPGAPGVAADVSRLCTGLQHSPGVA